MAAAFTRAGRDKKVTVQEKRVAILEKKKDKALKTLANIEGPLALEVARLKNLAEAPVVEDYIVTPPAAAESNGDGHPADVPAPDAATEPEVADATEPEVSFA